MGANRAAEAQGYVERLKENSYPGRGIIIGLSEDGSQFVQVYWIMGRSVNSRNRIFVAEENGYLRTEARDPDKLTDPSLIIYYPVKHYGGAHVVTNGDQTDTIHEAIQMGVGFETALLSRSYEPDAPHYTPRISGLVDLGDSRVAYRLSILKSAGNAEDQTLRHSYTYESAIAGFGHCIHTYQGDGDPLPSFAGEPLLVPLAGDAEQIASYYWNALNVDNKVSLLVKTIDRDSGASRIVVVNKD